MELKKVTQIIDGLLVTQDLKSLSPIKDKETWINQLKAALNLIPVCGGALAQEVQNIKDYRDEEFFRKFTSFILEFTDICVNDREEFAKELENKAEDYSGNVILNLVDRLDNINKEKILANLVKSRINRSISIDDFFRLSSMLERIPYVDLINLPKYQVDYYDENGDTELLFATGALVQTSIDANDNSKYKLSILGQKLLIYGMGIELEIERKIGTEMSLNVATDEDIAKIFEEQHKKHLPIVEGETLIFR